jgi:methionyl-tRNA synthetase
VQDSKLGWLSRESGRSVQWVAEDNYRFRLHQYLEPVEAWLRSGRVVHPGSRVNDLLPFLREIKAQRMDLSVSRKRSSVQWGIPVPGDEEDQLIYVWIDALANYLASSSTNAEMHHIIGKDILK